MNSQDEYVRRILLKMGWKEIKFSSFSKDFHLKWIYIDSTQDYSLLADCQIYNHFKNNTELTSKGRLQYNLKHYSDFGVVNSEQFFPRCYDIGNDIDRNEFILQYNVKYNKWSYF